MALSFALVAGSNSNNLKHYEVSGPRNILLFYQEDAHICVMGSLLWTARGKEEHKILAPRVCLQTAAAKGCCGFMGREGILASPAMLLYINLKYRKVLNHIFDRQLFSAKRHCAGGRPFLPLQDHSLQGTKTQYIYIPLHPLKTPNKLLAGFPTEKFY